MIPLCCKSPANGQTGMLSADTNTNPTTMQKHGKAKTRTPKDRKTEGPLLKYTNVMKGWQTRWFVLDPITGILQYFQKEEQKKLPPRGCVHLATAQVSPSEEDGQTFVVAGVKGEVFRLKASDSKERKQWVDTLRTTAQLHSTTNSQYPVTVQRCRLPAGYHLANKEGQARNSKSAETSISFTALERRTGPTTSSSSLSSPLEQMREYIEDATGYAHTMCDKISSLPYSGDRCFIKATDKDLMLLKAISGVTLKCLGQCLSVLENVQEFGFSTDKRRRSLKAPNPPNLRERYQSIVSNVLPITRSTDLSFITSGENGQTAPRIDDLHGTRSYFALEEEEEDKTMYQDTNLEAMEEHKSVILHLLSQVQLGMDLTKITLPTFILERRSLLEMFADCMAHPDLFLRIPDEKDPEKRMLLVLEWYLTSFHAGRQVEVAKKPYNPIVGETFHCSWLIPTQAACSSPSSSTDRKDGRPTTPSLTDKHSKSTRLVYYGEQVSHHPPVSAFYFECVEKKMCMNASIWTKSRFMGMSIGVSMVGQLTLRLLGHGEDYVFGLPSAYARSILSVPWVEMGDKISLTCDKTHLCASVTFHTKPFYGGKPHRVSGEVRNTVTGAILCKVAGEWNTTMEFTYADGKRKVVDTRLFKVWRKRVRSLHKQGEFESRRLWQHVSNALRVGDVNTATEHKRCLEDNQREGERHRKKTQTTFPTQENDQWVFNDMLTLTSASDSAT